VNEVGGGGLKKWGEKKSRDNPVAEKSYAQRRKPKLTVQTVQMEGES